MEEGTGKDGRREGREEGGKGGGEREREERESSRELSSELPVRALGLLANAPWVRRRKAEKTKRCRGPEAAAA